MRSTLVRLAVLSAGVGVVLSCDSGPTLPRFGNGISGGPTGTSPVQPPAPGSPDTGGTFLRIITVPNVRCAVTPRTQINVGDLLPVCVQINDDRQLGSLRITGYRDSGDVNLGTFVRRLRYSTVLAPTTGNFALGVVDTFVTRMMSPALPVDSTIGPMVIEAILTDAAGNVDTALATVNVVQGPRVTILAPSAGTEWPRGELNNRVIIEVTHPQGVSRDTVVITGSNFADTIVTTRSGATSIIDTLLFPVPTTAIIGSTVRITATAMDVNGNQGVADPVSITIRAPGTRLPLVYQTLTSPARLEIDDDITLRIEGDSITGVGRKLYDLNTNALISDVSTTFAARPGGFNITLPLSLTIADQGRSLYSISYAFNTQSDTGWSLPAGVTVADTTEDGASRTTIQVVYGRTFAPPRAGVIGDIAVDTRLGQENVFISNTAHNILEVWNNSTKTFDANGVAVGAQPWGLAVSLSGANTDTLLVANSGATTISRVSMSAKREDLARRIRTRNNVIYQVAFTRDPNTGLIRLTEFPPISYSDRPQYIAQSEGGRIYFSTRPTSSATSGTIRWMDPTQPIPDARQITSYIELESGATALIYTIFDADSIDIVPRAATGLSDLLVVYDHPNGQAGPTVVNSDINPPAAVDNLGTDAYWLLNVSVPSLALTDTTFVAASGDRKWIGFGEGNAQPAGRIMMINDPLGGPLPPFFSPAVSVTDIIDNASERVFGIAIDPTGLQVIAHGFKTYVAALDNNFHLRLDGEYDSFDNGAGVAFHPQANDGNPDNRVAFTATDNGIIEIFDVAHYNNRGRLTTKGNLYGALRVTGRMSTDPADVVAKVYGLTDGGLVVIDVRAADIRPAP